MKNKKIKLIVIYLLFPVLMLVTTSYAWFYINQQVDITYTPNIECEAGHSLEISIDGGKTWSGGAQATSATPKMLDITGDGINLYKPITVDEQYQPQGFTTATKINEETGEGDFIELEVQLRTNSQMEVYLSGDSFVSPVAEGTATNSIFGNFSKNYIAGAVRVAVTEKDSSGKETLKMLWDPNPYYKLTRHSNGTYSFNKTIEKQTASKDNNVDAGNYQYYYLSDSGNSIYSVKKFTMDEIVNKKISLGQVGGTNELTAGDSPVLTTFVPDGTQKMMYKTLMIRVWFEGTDREADQALSGGVIKMYFKFNGVNKAAVASANQTAIDNITYSNNKFNNLKNGYQYSFNGYEWNTYAGESLDTTKFKTWYWRYPETETNLASAYKKISIE